MTSLFPTTNLDINNYIEPTNDELPLFREFAWDFKENDFILENGNYKIVEGIEALKIWIIKALKTPRFRYLVYSWNYGSELESLIGKSYQNDLLQSEVQRLVREALEINKYIIGVTNCVAKKEDDIIHVKFTANTIYGEVDIDV